ncbi:MAG: threonine--tRNA ligase, partial [Nitrospirales bacterium]|nr:threonine--tRNA ligase [Nitrospirales bacterium]
ISERQDEFAQGIYRALRSAGIRAEINRDNEKIGYKIREATMRKIPYLAIIGDKEVEEGAITVRKRSGENIGPFTIPEFIALMKEEIESKKPQEVRT